AEADAQPERALVPDHRPVPGRLAHDHGCRLAERAGNAREVRRSFAARLLAGYEDEGKAGFAQRRARKVQSGGDHRGDAALHVGRAATVETALVRLAREGVARP